MFPNNLETVQKHLGNIIACPHREMFFKCFLTISKLLGYIWETLFPVQTYSCHEDACEGGGGWSSFIILPNIFSALTEKPWEEKEMVEE